jgi:hypothetical protein
VNLGEQKNIHKSEHLKQNETNEVNINLKDRDFWSQFKLNVCGIQESGWNSLWAELWVLQTF